MKKEEFVNLVCNHMGESPYVIIKKKHGSVPQIALGQFLEAVFEQDTIPLIAEYFNVSIQTINRILRNLFPEVKLLGKRTWRYYLLDEINFKKCNSCDNILDKNNFYADNSGRSHSGVASICKSCDNIQTNERIELGKDANISIIAIIYAGCPEGYHVDHIMPVSRGGKHHENNLCYLPAKLNISKSDRMPETVPEIMKHAIYPEFKS